MTAHGVRQGPVCGAATCKGGCKACQREKARLEVFQLAWREATTVRERAALARDYIEGASRDLRGMR